MQLRPRQAAFVDRYERALRQYQNTLGIAPTGAGKTVMLSAVAGRIGGNGCILQHRDELVEQNQKTFRKVNPRIPTSLVTAEYKRWQPNGATFAMIQTLSRASNLDMMPALDYLLVDEGHHVTSDSYLRVIDRAKKQNPNVMVGLFTATPRRADKRHLRAVVDNIADQITLGELIRSGDLVPPRALVIDTGTEGELGAVKKTINDFDMAAVERIMNRKVINEKVVQEWKKHAGNRLTVVFTSTVQHARDMVEEFHRQDVSARIVHGEMSDYERAETLAAFDRLEFQVIVNVAVLTEGWDCPPVSCVVLLRPCSHKSTMIQMIGRGLRKIDPERYPHVKKDDCVVLDFGYSLHTHRDLEQVIRLDNQDEPKLCPGCQASVPGALYECPICGYAWPAPITEPRGPSAANDDEDPLLEDFVLTEVDLFQRSPFLWEDLFDGMVTISNALEAWACIVQVKDRWVAVGGSGATGMHLLADNEHRLLSLSAADDFLREYGDDDAASKNKQWLHMPATVKQMSLLQLNPMGGMGMSRYRASCLLTWRFNEKGIRNKVLLRGIRAAA